MLAKLRIAALAALFLARFAAVPGGAAYAADADAMSGDGARQASDDLPPALLAACDARAASFGEVGFGEVDFGEVDRGLAAAAGALVALGVFSADEFTGVRAGFCALRDAGGPVATTSCADDTILFDDKYRAKDQGLALAATLAHEMKHRAQHAELIARHGAGYCLSDQYRNDRAALEREADAFGDAVGALLFLGRAVEIRNECPVAMSVYLEAAKPASAPAAVGPIDVAPGAAAQTALRSAGGAFKLYAHARGADRIWDGGTSDGRQSGERRMIGGKAVRLKNLDLPAAAPASGPFVLRLRCGEAARRVKPSGAGAR